MHPSPRRQRQIMATHNFVSELSEYLAAWLRCLAPHTKERVVCSDNPPSRRNLERAPSDTHSVLISTEKEREEEMGRRGRERVSSTKREERWMGDGMLYGRRAGD